jgi:hypothetical protein
MPLVSFLSVPWIPHLLTFRFQLNYLKHSGEGKWRGTTNTFCMWNTLSFGSRYWPQKYSRPQL